MKHSQKAMSLVLILSGAVLFMGSRWARTYGGNNTDLLYSIDKTSDGGFVVAGLTRSNSAGLNDIEITKIDGRGIVQWHRLLGGSADDEAVGIRQMPDGGYIVLGEAGTGSPGFAELYLCKLSSTGAMIWQKTYGGASTDRGYSLELTPDGGFVVAGGGGSFPRLDDYWVIKFNADGDSQWQKIYGGSSADRAFQIKRTSDGGYIVVGYSYSYGGGIDGALWIVKLGINGDIQWQKSYVIGRFFPRGIAQTPDGGYAVLVYADDLGAGTTDVLILKLSADGTVAWARTYGGTKPDIPCSIAVTSDGSILFSGMTQSFGHGDYDLWLVKLNSSGGIIWERTYGGTELDGSGTGDALLEAPGNSLLVGGYTYGWSAGGTDLWILRLFSDGTLDEGNPLVGTSSATVKSHTIIGLPTTATALTPSVSTGLPSFTSRSVALTSTLITEVLLSPPASVTLQRAVNRNLFRKEAYHTITWTSDSRNAKFQLAGYNLYRKLEGAPDSSYILLAELPASTFSYVDPYLDVAKTYVYMLQTEDVEGDISAASTTVRNSTAVR
jgi:uncharacterized delta-60 repeat protein